MPTPHGTWKDLLPMLIAVLLIAALALLVGAFLTGSTGLAAVALVVSLGTAVLYVVSLRTVPAADAEAVGTGDGEPAAEKAPVAAAPVATTAEERSAEKAPATTAPVGTATTDEAPAVAGKAPAGKPPEKSSVAVRAPATGTPGAASGGDGAAPAPGGTSVVHVVPGRLRYHVQGCQVIDGQEVEDLTLDDARDEGFTACSRCAVHGRSRATA